MICLTLDTDHVDARRMEDFLALAELPAPATFFCTERYASLEGAGHELCPHPFLDLDGDWRASLRAAREVFPDAAGCRPHSCLYSHLIAVTLTELGFKYASTQAADRAAPRPFREPWGVWQVPIFYMDNADFSGARWWPSGAEPAFSEQLLEAATANDAVYVYAFHPVHVLLNTPAPEYYLDRRAAFVAGADLESLRFDGYGTADFFERVCKLPAEFVTVAEAVARAAHESELDGSHSRR